MTEYTSLIIKIYPDYFPGQRMDSPSYRSPVHSSPGMSSPMSNFASAKFVRVLPIAVFVEVLAILFKFIGAERSHDDGFVTSRAALNAYVFAAGKRSEVDINPRGSVLECQLHRHHPLEGKVIFRVNQGFDCCHAIFEYSNAMTAANPIIA